MSLINQMLKDLEQRGGFPSDTKFEPANSKSLQPDSIENKGKYTFLKISGALILLYCAVYLWVKYPTIFRAPHVNQSAEVTVASNEATNADDNAPLSITSGPTSTPAPENSTHTTAPNPQVPVAQTPSAIVENETMITPDTSNHDAATQDKALNATQTEITANKTTKKPVSKKLQKDIEVASSLTKSEFEDIAPATIAPVEIKKTKTVTNAMPKNAKNQPIEGFTKQESPAQKSTSLYLLALKDFEKGRAHEAEDQLKKALLENPANEDARQMLAALMVDNKKMIDAKNLLADGLTINPHQTEFRMAVARLQLESGEKQNALDTLMQGVQDAKNNADYQSFLATLLQRAERHEEAITYYNAAIGLQGNSPNSLIGLGISHQALGNFEEAKNAFSRVLSYNNINVELTNFVEQRLKQVNQHLKTQ